MSRTALLMSGGMDSTSLAFWKRPELAITFDYGQRSAQAEIAASSAICNELSIEHHILRVDCSSLGSGDLSNAKELDIAPKSDWWPFRNQMLITLAGMYVLQHDVNHIFVGSVKSDGYHKDGSADFFHHINVLMSNQEGGITISAPALELSTIELIERSEIPDKVLMWSHSCHKSNTPCCNCRGCNKYFDVFSQLKSKHELL